VEFVRVVCIGPSAGCWNVQGLLVVSAKLCLLHLGSSAAYWKLLPLLGPVADLQLSAPTEQEEKDVDLVEERKILFFLEAMADYKTVGVELAGGDVMEVEKWPLIQVYGIEELGGTSVLAMWRRRVARQRQAAGGAAQAAVGVHRRARHAPRRGLAPSTRVCPAAWRTNMWRAHRKSSTCGR
jgi:hypothetical protein